MKNLIEDIEKALQDTERLYRHTSEVYNGYLKSHYRGKMEAYINILESLKDYNIITAPKSIKLSEIVSKLNKIYEPNIYFNKELNAIGYGEYSNKWFMDTWTAIALIKNNKISRILKITSEETKWLYELWITGTIIEDDLECDE